MMGTFEWIMIGLWALTVLTFGVVTIYFIYKDVVCCRQKQPHTNKEFEKWLNEHFAPEDKND